MDPFPTTIRQLKFLVVGIDYFTKWVEVEALATITKWRNIICRTTARTPTGETPFRLANGSEVVILAEVGLASYRVENYDMSKNKEAIRLQLDLVDEVRATAEQRLARYQDLMAKYYNSKVRHRNFQVGDLVLKRVLDATRDASQGKLGPNWEGLYRIISWHRKGTYYLETLDGRKLSHLWNTEHLKK
ncbi:uncharacterized protein LOC142613515 [Castanea sativa]|uniref:uncharacterized protein LOC142613515 n=1 Tax=Castanea sativa TaxID=21020 RepID=UPI003F64EDF9